MKLWDVFTIASGVAVGIGVRSGRGVVEERRNLLFVVADDMSRNVFDQARTPNMDEFARKSVFYDQAHVQSTSCAPSRASMWTGRYVGELQNWNTSFVANSLTLPRHLTLNGYRTKAIGKIFHKPIVGTGKKSRDAFKDHWTDESVYDPKGNAECKRSMWCHMGKRRLVDRRNVETALKTIENFERSRRKWALFVGFRRPHTDIAVTGKKAPPPQKLPLTQKPVGIGKYECTKIHGRKIGRGSRPLVPKRYGQNPSLSTVPLKTSERARGHYVAAVEDLDALFGRLVDAVPVNTMIVFVSDHGWRCGEHGQWCKNALEKDLTHVPMIVGGDGRSPQKIRGPVEVVALFAHVCRTLGVPVPPKSDKPMERIRALSEYPRCKNGGDSCVEFDDDVEYWGTALNEKSSTYIQWQKATRNPVTGKIVRGDVVERALYEGDEEAATETTTTKKWLKRAKKTIEKRIVHH